MKRKSTKTRKITRTMYQTAISVMHLNTEKAEVITKDYVLFGKFDTDEDALESLKNDYPEYEITFQTLKPVHIVSRETFEVLIAMPERKFFDLGEMVDCKSIWNS